MVDTRGIGRLGIVLLAAAVGVAAGWFLFVEWGPDPLRVLLLLVTAGVLTWMGGNAAGNLLPEYNVAEVEVSGPITRDGGGGPLPTSPTSPGADDIVEQIERADDDGNVDALLVKLNTPGGAVVPSDDIRTAAMEFDGPTIAYTNDVCASGGYWIASGCDELWARESSIVGSIGVIMARPNATALAEKVGIDVEYLTAGEYKDAGRPFTEFTDDDREYYQELIDDQYDSFVERVADGRNLDPETIRDTEARVFLGTDAEERGLVDELGTRDDVEETLETELHEDVTVKEFTPQRSIAGRFSASARSVAYAAGAGLASVVDDDDTTTFELR
jgi:protease-4